jgi:hypothetical protein
VVNPIPLARSVVEQELKMANIRNREVETSEVQPPGGRRLPNPVPGASLEKHKFSRRSPLAWRVEEAVKAPRLKCVDAIEREGREI